MNRSWRNNAAPAPGFVYFNVNNSYQNPKDTSDFLAFGDSPAYKSPQNYHRFSPSNYSSPKYRNSPNSFNSRQYYSPGNHNKRSFNQSSNSSFSSTSSFGGRKRPKKRHVSSCNYELVYHNYIATKSDELVLFYFQHNLFDQNKQDISCFYDPTCTTDPWAELEIAAKEKEEAAQKAAIQQNNTTIETSDEESTSSSSSDEESDDTEAKSDDREDKSSNSSPEENVQQFLEI